MRRFWLFSITLMLHSENQFGIWPYNTCFIHTKIWICLVLQRQRWGGPESRTTSLERQVSAVLCCTYYVSTLLNSYFVWAQNFCYERQLSAKSILKVKFAKDYCPLYSPKSWGKFQFCLVKIKYWNYFEFKLASPISIFDQYLFLTSSHFCPVFF